MSWAKLEDDNLHYLMANMIPNIKCLNISGFLKQLADFGMLLVESCNATKLLKLIHLIVFCKVYGFYEQFLIYIENISDLSRLSSRCTKLIELDISDSLAITASSLYKILENNHELKVLSINRCYNIDIPRLLK